MASSKTQRTPNAGKLGEKPKRRRVKVKVGQLVAIPLQDGTFALGHVAHYLHHVTLAHFAHRASTPEGLLIGLEKALKQDLLAFRAITNVDIYDGNWPVIGQREPEYSPEMLDMRGVSSFSTWSSWFFNAYYGLVPWDGMKDPFYYERALLPGVVVPPTVRYKRDFEEDVNARGGKAPGTTVSAVGEAQETPPTEGPGEIHIEMKYEGGGLPTIPLLKRRQAIEDAITSAGVGDITDAGGGGGVMDIYLETEDVARALPVVRAAIQQAGFGETARVEVAPLDDEAL